MMKSAMDELATSPELFSVGKGVLRSKGDLYWEYLEEFEAACDRLLDSRRARISVDLTNASFISSSFLGCLANLVLNASRLKKRVILKVTLDTSWLFDIMGKPENMELTVQ